MNFPEVKLDDVLIEKLSYEACNYYISTMYKEDNNTFKEYFDDIKFSSLDSKLVRVSYIKNIVVEDLSDHFEQPSEFLFSCTRYIYILNEENKEHLATYTLILDEKLNLVDDYLN